MRRFRSSALLTLGAPPFVQRALPFDDPFLPRFVVKRHRATTLHTDFRIEVYGVLLSWVFHDRPSLVPGVPVRGVLTHDHAMRWIDGERRIPEGRYGAGPMVVWDGGTYRPLGRGTDVDETAFLTLRAGRLDFEIQGVRLKGAFRLATAGRDWTLTKLEDEHATTSPTVWDDVSVLTGRSLEDLERAHRGR